MQKRLVPKLPLSFNNEFDLNKLIEYKVKEDIHIAFRSFGELDITNQKKRQTMLTLVSAMSNSVGGTIFFGIDSQRNRASALKPGIFSSDEIDKLEYTLKSEIHPSPDSIHIYTITCSDGGAIVIMEIPNSEYAPHMSGDGYYYKRQDNKNIKLEEFEIRDLYQRSKKAELDIFAILNTNGIPTIEGGRYQKVNFYPRFLVKNISSAIEHHYKTELFIPSGIYNPNFSVLQQHFSRLEDQYSVFSVANSSPIFQHELATVMEANLVVDAESFDIFAKNDIIVKLFYSNGIKTKYYRMKDTFLYQNKPLSADDFAEQLRLFN